MDKKNGPVWLIICLFLIALYFTFYDVDQSEHGLVLQLGKPLDDPLEPGLHVKIPGLHKVVLFDARLMDFNLPAVEMLTSDAQHIIVENYAKWRIVDPLKFYETVRHQEEARVRLGNIMLAEIETEIGRHTLGSIVSSLGPAMMENITRRVDQAAEDYGISVVDLRLRRINLPKENERTFFARMRSERDGLADNIMAEGKAAAAKIKAVAEKERDILLAEAYRRSQEIRGEGDAQAARIFAEAVSLDPAFFNFVRTLEVYRKTIDGRTTLFLSRNDEIMTLMKNRNTLSPPPGPTRPQPGLNRMQLDNGP